MSSIIDHKSTEVQRAGVAVTTPADLLRLAVEQGADLDKLERLMDLQDRHLAAQARREYDLAFAAFKAEAVRIVKGKAVSDGPLKGKSYAELNDVVNAVTPALSKHGLSSSWKLTKDDKDWLEVTCYLRHIGGHEESVSMGGPPDTGGAKNAIQARASSKTYLERYTLKAITGLSEEGDDTDANVYRESAIDEWTKRAKAANSEKDLREAQKEGASFFSKARDKDGYTKFMAAATERLEEIKRGNQ